MKSTKKENQIGIIDSIIEILKKTKKELSVQDILEKMVKKFPERDSNAMKHTIYCQLGGSAKKSRIEVSKGIKIKKTKSDSGTFFSLK